MAKSPYFNETPVRKSTRVSNASIHSSSRKRVALSSESDFEDSESSASDFESTQKETKNKRVKIGHSSDPDENDEDEDEDSDDESKPFKTVIIPLPKARAAGDIPYEDGRIHENTMLFLKDLKAHNNREWMRCISPHALPDSFSDEIDGQSMMKTFAYRRKTFLRS